MHDLIIVLPGIMGSVLTKRGRELWAPSLSAVARAFQRETLVRDLVLQGDDPELPTLDDEIVATRLMPDVHIIPGFWKIDGYTSLINAIQEQFDVTIGNIYNPDPNANLFPFPYDWRRDNRSAARRLEAFIARQLPIWQERSGSTRAKVILICHSMGGLIARYYLEALSGHETCRALYTFGTPHRGSLNALNYLVNGYNLLKWLDVSVALRSYTSVYQLLPIYEIVERDGTFVLPTELTGIDGFVADQARIAREQFHDHIAATVSARRKGQLGYDYTLIIGAQQHTGQSARLEGGKLTIRDELPASLISRDYPRFGDGTVPHYAAQPPGLRPAEITRLYVVERHSSLQTNVAMQQHLLESLHALQVEGDVLGSGSFASGMQPGLRLVLEDAYPADGGLITVQPADVEGELGDLLVTLTPLDGNQPPERRMIPPKDGVWTIILDHPTPGLYRVNAEPYIIGSGKVRPVQDLFEVALAPIV